MVLAAAAVAALAGCAKESVAEQTPSGAKLVDVKFTAEIPAYQTTKSTVDVDGLTFNTRWADGDKMGLKYEAMSELDDAIVDVDNKLAEFSSSDASFIVKEMESCTGEWAYYGYFPYQYAQADDNSVSVPFGPQRVQDGNAINSQYDVMYADKLNFAKADAGLTGVTGEGKPISFQMNRVTSLLHFHFTSSLDEPVIKATLTAEGDPIAAKNIELHYFAEKDYKTGDILTDETFNTIELTFTNAPSAKDFTLWFNILPYGATSQEAGIENIKLVVETETKTFSITNPNSELDLYEAGQVHSIDLNIPSSAWKDKETPTPPVTDELFFYESFDGNTVQGGNDGNWSQGSGSDKSYDNDGWNEVSNVYAANGCLRLGGSSSKGEITTPKLGITTSSAKLSFCAGAWNNSKESLTLNVEVVDGGTIEPASVTLKLAEWTEYTCTITNATENTKVKFVSAQDSKNRFFLDEVYVYTGTKPSKPEKPSLDVVSPTLLTLTARGGTTEAFAVTTNQESWDAVSDNDAFTVNKAESGFTVSAPLNPTLAERKATITVTAGNAEKKTVTITQSAASFEITNDEVVLKATAGSSVQRTITSDYDWTASVSADAKFTVSPVEYTYSNDGKQVVKFIASEDNSSVDGTITLGTVVFSNTVNEEKITVTVKQESSYVAPFITISPESSSVVADATSASFEVKSNVDWTVSTDAGWVTLGTTSGSNDGTVALSFTANAGEADRTATVTVGSADATISRTYTLVQKKVGGSEKTETYSFASFVSANDVTLTAANFTIKMSKGTGSTQPAWVSSEARLYPNGTMTISSTKKIVKVEFDYTINANKKGKKPTISSVRGGASDGGNWNETKMIWENSVGDTLIVMSTTGSAGNIGFKSITVTFVEE